ncbi:hypothetical protein LEP1GSC186_1614 [Leptospira noguchii serovar Autumnalis str. ZUN142]|uniref:Uncharacterized protein n=1 Tax=Leptospira noguchii serovar Autumnalis str. ZUN142 TaxID=1085540 RepID=M6UD26_9LEPT|nr:hypothetical protein [Leptospira noguchii]EMO42460.1 hypothetical protein LEP1GSC186_1614 [Leptospira noguchii serovar Autumnalis str. ZUN142]
MSFFSGKIKYGCLWGMLITFLISVGAVTLFLKLKYNFYNRHSIKDWIFEISICFMLSLLVGIWFEIKDSESLKTLRIFWPILWKSHNYIKTLRILLYKKFV